MSFSQLLRYIHFFDKGISLATLILLSFFSAPLMIIFIVPIILFLCASYEYYQMIKEGEVIALQNAGLNDLKIIAPALKFSTIVGFICLVNSSIVSPYANSVLKDTTDFFRNTFINSIIQPKSFNLLSKSLILYTEESYNKVYNNILLFDFSPKKNIVIAKSGEIKFLNGEIFINLSDGIIKKSKTSLEAQEVVFKSLLIKIVEEHKTLRKKDLSEKYLHELFINNDPSDKMYTKKISEGHQRIVWALLCPILTFCSLQILLMQQRLRNISEKILILPIFLCTVFTILNVIVFNYASKNHLFIVLIYLNLFTFFLASYFKYNVFFIFDKFLKKISDSIAKIT